MKNKIKIIALFLVFCIGTIVIPQKASAQISVDFQVFYDDLSPYGNWIENANYGYVWAPNVYSGFTPYATNGYWVFTDDGWTWISNYSWGWAPFHYGRWFYEPGYGWLWAPDNEWGPGWVSWRRSEGYYGWAPIGPGINIDMAYSSGYNLPYNQWTFVRDRDFGRTNINNYYINNSNNVTIFNTTTVINNIRTNGTRNVRYNAGPDRTEVEKRAGKTFNPVSIRDNNKPGQSLRNNELQIYRPQVEKNNVSGRKPIPSKVQSLKEIKTSEPRITTTPVQKSNQQQQKNIQQKQQQQLQQQKNTQQQQQLQQQERNTQQQQQQLQQQQRNTQQKQQQLQQQQRNTQQKQQQQLQQQQRNTQQQRTNNPQQKQQQLQQKTTNPQQKPTQQKDNNQQPQQKPTQQ